MWCNVRLCCTAFRHSAIMHYTVLLDYIIIEYSMIIRDTLNQKEHEEIDLRKKQRKEVILRKKKMI